MSSQTFNVGDYVIYPSHGVGKITNISSQTIANFNMDMYHIFFESDQMNLSVPVDRASKIGLRGLCDEDTINDSLKIISEKAQTTRGIMWSRRAQEYERKINSGSLLSVAEVIRDLYRNVKNPDRSYSERLIYENAYNRFVSEVCLVKNLKCEEFEKEFNQILKVDEIEDNNDDDDFFDNDDGGVIAA